MPTKKYIVRLSDDERDALTRLVKTGKAAAYKRQRAQILLKANENRPNGGSEDNAIAELLDVGVRTVERARRRLVEKGFEKVLEREPQSGSRRPRLDGEQEAQLIALSCSNFAAICSAENPSSSFSDIFTPSSLNSFAIIYVEL